MKPSAEPGSPTSGTGSPRRAEPLPDDAFVVTPEVAEALERNRPGPMTLDQYARFVKRFHFTAEQLRAIPLASGERFRLD